MKKIRYAVVGAGWISQEAFLPSVAQTGNSEMTAIVTGNAANAAKLADFYGIEHVFAYERYEEMLAADIVDAVYIALPNSLHADYAIRASRAGKHVLVEKPLAITVEECEAMIAAADEAGVFLMTAYRLHTDPGTIEVLEQIRNGKIGDPRIFTSIFSYQATASNHRLKAEHWGGPLQDIGVYCLNAARHVFAAEPVEAIAMKGSGDNDPRFDEVEEAIAVTLRFPGGRLAQFVASFGADTLDTYRVVGTKGEITLEPGFRFETDTNLRLRQDEVVVLEKPSPSVDHFGGQTAYFSDCILNGVRPEPDGEEGLADVRAMLAIERAAATGKPQKIDTPPRPSHPMPEMVRHIPRTDRRLVF
ncbi:Gfo/Idh/MocA family oxidoreductase [Rhizobiales bacterium]|uniref:Gfo/Idh/MocA family protein n=1 Tax=Hongsoonwoonella zoysiae TaxID=2821844 RepID=UPI00155F7060|nr:Gfo/Idh/MocA family oxidoreductase [Hongsoonwoonella zoysiae]NRG18254.1 Gfo/Idh/MocA family oxidoreductase [Hongsoonwoonella zoysiae]